MALSDRVIVLCNGRKTGELTRAEMTIERIGAYMAGIDDEAERSETANAVEK